MGVVLQSAYLNLLPKRFLVFEARTTTDFKAAWLNDDNVKGLCSVLERNVYQHITRV